MVHLALEAPELVEEVGIDTGEQIAEHSEHLLFG
jgi:hypothetical protein